MLAACRGLRASEVSPILALILTKGSAPSMKSNFATRGRGSSPPAPHRRRPRDVARDLAEHYRAVLGDLRRLDDDAAARLGARRSEALQRVGARLGRKRGLVPRRERGQRLQQRGEDQRPRAFRQPLNVPSSLLTPPKNSSLVVLRLEIRVALLLLQPRHFGNPEVPKSRIR